MNGSTSKAAIPSSNGTPFTTPYDAFATPNLSLQKQISPVLNGPFPPTFYSSLPTLGKEGSNTIYYITSAKSFSSGTYYAVLNGQLQLIGQAKATKKADAVSAAENMAKNEQILERLVWSFEDRNIGGQNNKMKKVNLLNKSRESTGVVPLLTHALAVAETDKARFALLEWFSGEKKAYVHFNCRTINSGKLIVVLSIYSWKCAVLIDSVYYGSAKHVDRKQAGELHTAP